MLPLWRHCCRVAGGPERSSFAPFVPNTANPTAINTTGTLRARATKVGADTALAQIVKMVQEAQNSKAPGQRLADRAAFWLVLVALLVVIVALGVWNVRYRPRFGWIVVVLAVVLVGRR